MADAIEEFRGKAARVAAEDAEHNAAIAEERALAARLIDQLVETVRPALPALCSPVPGYAIPCLLIPEAGGLHLREDGRWLILAPGNSPMLSSGEVVGRGVRCTKIASALLRALDAQLDGGKVRHTARIVAGHQRLRAVITLLGGK